MGDFGFLQVKKGFDAFSATPNQQIINSKYNTPNIYQESRVTPSTAGGTGISHITHLLGYKPGFLAFSYRGTTDAVNGKQWSNAVFHAESGFYHRIWANSSTFNHGIMVTSDATNLNIQVNGASAQSYPLYIYTLVDLAEESAAIPPQNKFNYGARVSQPGYDALTDPDYRMIFSSKYAMFQILKTGVISLSVPSVTLSQHQEDIQFTEVTFASLGIPNGFYAYLSMIKDITAFNVIPTSAGMYLPLGGRWTFNGQDVFETNISLFITNDRVVLYCWRSYQPLVGVSNPSTKTYSAIGVDARFMLMNNKLQFP